MIYELTCTPALEQDSCNLHQSPCTCPIFILEVVRNYSQVRFPVRAPIQNLPAVQRGAHLPSGRGLEPLPTSTIASLAHCLSSKRSEVRCSRC